MSAFPDELYTAPRSWAEKAYPKLIHYNKLPKGGHFAAWEQPDSSCRKCVPPSGRCANRGPADAIGGRPSFLMVAQRCAMKRALLAAVLVVAIGAVVAPLGLERTMSQQLEFIDAGASVQNLPSLSGANGWINTSPLSAEDLHGKVVLVQFWTYSCINWLRTEPYIQAWAEKYRDQGLVVIGVHSPEFGFEKNADNVRWAVENFRIDYPIAIDSDHAIWRAFANQYWPALYLVDARGRIRYHQFGEGGYAETERTVQRLLTEAGVTGIVDDLVSVDGSGPESAADWDHLLSPETYVGYGRADNFSSPGGIAYDTPKIYEAPENLSLNHWALAGEWSVGREAAANRSGNGRVAFRFRARDLNLVMGPAVPGTTVRFRVSIDGELPGAARGVDVDAEGNGTAREQRLYQLIRQPQPVADRTVVIEFLEPGVEAFSFTFG